MTLETTKSGMLLHALRIKEVAHIKDVLVSGQEPEQSFSVRQGRTKGNNFK